MTALTESAAPPRASPSSLVSTTPSNSARLGERLGDVDRVLAGHRVDDEQHVVRLGRACGSSRARPSAPRRRAGGRRCRRSARRAPSRLAWSSAQLGDLDRVARRCPARRRRRPPALADRDQLLDRGRAGRRRRRRARRPCPARCRQRASLAQAVVLPEPCRPAIRITVGPAEAKARSRPAPPISAVSSSLTILTTCWPGLRLSSTSAPEAALLDRRGELLDDLEVDVGLEQREADLAHRLVDVVLGQLAAGANVGERRLEAV